MKKTKKKVTKKKENKDIFKLLYIKPFDAPVIFFYSDSMKNIPKHLNIKKNKYISDWLKKHISDLPTPEDNEDGGLIYSKETQRPLIIFIKRKKTIKWNTYETMIHEITHLVQHLETYFAFNDEQEFRAYLTESIFKDLRKLI